MRADIQPGATFPDYELPDQTGQKRRLSELQEGYPMTTFYPELWADLREVTRRCRPDWDITTPEPRASWERVERGRIFPYGRSLREVFAEGTPWLHPGETRDAATSVLADHSTRANAVRWAE